MSADPMIVVDGRRLCGACNVRPEWPGEHRCWRSDSGQTCECPNPLCRLDRGEVSVVELEAEDAAREAARVPGTGQETTDAG